MSIFSFFGEHETRKFNYKPIYYDPAEEERREIFGAVDGTRKKESKDKPYVPGQYIRESRFDGDGQQMPRDTTMKKIQTLIGIVTLFLIAAVLYYIASFYQLL